MKDKFIIVFSVIVIALILVIISFQSQKSDSKDTDLISKKNRISEVTDLAMPPANQGQTQQENPKLDRKISNRERLPYTAISPRKNLEFSGIDIEVINIIKKSLESGSVLAKAQENIDPLETIEEAFDYMNMSVNMAYVPQKYLYDNEAFYFSGGTTSDEVLNFSSGIAVKKKDRTITSWDSGP